MDHTVEMGRWYRRGLASTVAVGLVALAVAGMATAVGADTSRGVAPDGGSTAAYDSHVTITVGAVDNDTSAQEQWAARGPANYRYVWVTSAMVGTSSTLVEVRGRRVVFQAPLTGTTIGPDARTAPTIDEVFSLVRAAQQRADQVQTTYNAAWGYPSSVHIDDNLDAVDDEHTFSVEALEPL